MGGFHYKYSWNHQPLDTVFDALFKYSAIFRDHRPTPGLLKVDCSRMESLHSQELATW